MGCITSKSCMCTMSLHIYTKVQLIVDNHIPKQSRSQTYIVNRTIRCAIHGRHQIIIGSIACSQSPPFCNAFYLTMQLSMPSVVHKTLVLSIFLEYSRIVCQIPPPTTEGWLLVESSCEITNG